MEDLGMCEMCGMRKATVFLKKNINGKVTERHLCAHCAGLVQQNGNVVDKFLGGDLIAEMLGMTHRPATKMRVCKCGTTERDVLENYRFGCSECYKTFADIADKYVARLGGKVYCPKNAVKETSEKPSERERLERELQDAVDKKDFLLANEIKLMLDALGGER